jgi:hypothetical protein
VSLPARVTTLVIAFLVVVAGVTFVALHFIAAQPPVADYTPYASGGQVNVFLQTDPQTTVTNKPDWVSYFIQDPQTKQWVHTTYFAVPTNTKVNVTILGYDGCTPLRNPYWGMVTGTLGKVENVSYFNGKTYSPSTPVSSFNSYAQCSVEHTFAIPGLGLEVPVASVTTVKENNSLCSVSPCVADNSSGALAPHTVVKFSFMTPKAGGTFRWQCFIPCGGGYLDGNGGPMGTPGYMMGQMEVQA